MKNYILLLISLTIFTACSTSNDVTGKTGTALATRTAPSDKHVSNSKAELPSKKITNEVPILPEWLNNPPLGMVTTCVRIKNGNVITAQKIAKIKAQAEYLAAQNVSIEASSELENTALVNNRDEVIRSSFKETIKQNTEGNVRHSQTIKKSIQIILDNWPHLCVLFG